MSLAVMRLIYVSMLSLPMLRMSIADARPLTNTAYNILGDKARGPVAEKTRHPDEFWRPIKTVHRSPLALVDAATVKKEDLNFAEVRGGLNDPNRPPLYGWNLSYNPDHQWYYATEMQPYETFAFG